MEILSITGNPKKGGALASLVIKAEQGARECGVPVGEIRLSELHINFCRFCLFCTKNLEAEIAPCSQKDDMAWILERIRDANGFILSCPASGGHASAIMKTFEERCVYTLGRPTRRILWVKGCPSSRIAGRQRYAVILTTAGVVPTWSRALCDGQSSQMAALAEGIFHAKVVGRLYAGLLWRRKLDEAETNAAYQLGKRLAQSVLRSGT